MMIVGDANALQLFGQLIMKLSNHPSVTSLMKGTNRHAYIFRLIPQTLKREQPKPIEGNQQTEEIILTKGTKGETFFPLNENTQCFFFTCSMVVLKRGCPVGLLSIEFNKQYFVKGLAETFL